MVIKILKCKNVIINRKGIFFWKKRKENFYLICEGKWERLSSFFFKRKVFIKIRKIQEKEFFRQFFELAKREFICGNNGEDVIKIWKENKIVILVVHKLLLLKRIKILFCKEIGQDIYFVSFYVIERNRNICVSCRR